MLVHLFIIVNLPILKVTVVSLFKQVLRFWLDRDVDGFRVDAISKLFEVEDRSLDEPRTFHKNMLPVKTFSNLIHELLLFNFSVDCFLFAFFWWFLWLHCKNAMDDRGKPQSVISPVKDYLKERPWGQRNFLLEKFYMNPWYQLRDLADWKCTVIEFLSMRVKSWKGWHALGNHPILNEAKLRWWTLCNFLCRVKGHP